jgi:phage tail-like protein
MSMGFMSASGLNITTEVIPYREGGMNTTTQKMPGQSDFAPITLSKGLIVGEAAR